MAAKKRSAVRIYFVDPNTDEVVGSMSMSASLNEAYDAFFHAKSERLKIVLAKSRAAAEDAAAGVPNENARLFTATAFGHFMVSQGMLPPLGLKAPRPGAVRRKSTKKRTSKKAASKKVASKKRTSKKSAPERRSWLESRLTSTKRKKTSKRKTSGR